MGWGAAQQFYEDNSAWVDSPEQAYEILYGKADRPAKKKPACGLCGRKFRSKRALTDHMRDRHEKAPDE